MAVAAARFVGREHEGREVYNVSEMEAAGQQQHQLPHENEYDENFKEFAARHRRLLDGEAIDVRERAQLLLHTRLPLIQSKTRRGKRKESRGVDIADDLQGIFSPVGQLGHLDEQRVDLAHGSRISACQPVVQPSLTLQLRVDAFEFRVEQLIVVTKFEQLRVRKFEDLDGGLRAGFRVEDEGAVPCRDDQVVGEIRNAMPQDLVALFDAQRASLGAQQLDNCSTSRRNQCVRRHRFIELCHGENEVVLGEEF